MTRERLAEDSVKIVFNPHLQQSFNHILEVAGNMGSEWAVFHLPLLRWLLEAAVVRLLVLVVALTLGPAGGHQS